LSKYWAKTGGDELNAVIVITRPVKATRKNSLVMLKISSILSHKT